MQNWLEFPFVLPICVLLLLQTLLYSHSSHRLLSLCCSLGMFHLLCRYTLPSLLTMISIYLHNNQGKDHNAISTIQLIHVFNPLWLNHLQKLGDSDFLQLK